VTAVSRLAPQMADYDRWGAAMAWRPYIMYFQPPNLRTACCNTDGLGFRFSSKVDGNVARVDQWDRSPSNLLFGNSVAFSVGATTDANSLAARMTWHTSETWLNFAGRAFAASQELLTFLYYRHRLGPVRRIVLFSGSNDLYLYYVPKMFDEIFGIFFFSDVFATRMSASPDMRWAERVWKAAVPTRLKKRRSPERDLTSVIAERRPDRARAVELWRRSLEHWRILAAGLGIDLVYALQPIMTWVSKPPSPEELELSRAWLENPSGWTAILQAVMDLEHYEWWSGALAAECRKMGVRFVDMNMELSRHPRRKEWLFIDHLHLTDAGYDVCGEILARELGYEQRVA
jgi:hypothetical protein